MPQHASSEHVNAGVVSAVKPPTDLSTSVETSNSSTPATAPPASTTTTTSNDERVADAGYVDMETSMTTTADVEVHDQDHGDHAATRHVRFDTETLVFFQCSVFVNLLQTSVAHN